MPPSEKEPRRPAPDGDSERTQNDPPEETAAPPGQPVSDYLADEIGALDSMRHGIPSRKDAEGEDGDDDRTPD